MYQTAAVENTDAADWSDVEDELLVSWIEEPPSQNTTRLTTVLEYPTPTNEENNTNTYPQSDPVPSDSDFLLEQPSVDQSVRESHSSETTDTAKPDLTDVTDVETTTDNHLPSDNQSNGHDISAECVDRDPPQTHSKSEDNSNTLLKSPDQSSDVSERETRSSSNPRFYKMMNPSLLKLWGGQRETGNLHRKLTIQILEIP